MAAASRPGAALCVKRLNDFETPGRYGITGGYGITGRVGEQTGRALEAPAKRVNVEGVGRVVLPQRCQPPSDPRRLVDTLRAPPRTQRVTQRVLRSYSEGAQRVLSGCSVGTATAPTIPPRGVVRLKGYSRWPCRPCSAAAASLDTNEACVRSEYDLAYSVCWHCTSCARSGRIGGNHERATEQNIQKALTVA